MFIIGEELKKKSSLDLLSQTPERGLYTHTRTNTHTQRQTNKQTNKRNNNSCTELHLSLILSLNLLLLYKSQKQKSYSDINFFQNTPKTIKIGKEFREFELNVQHLLQLLLIINKNRITSMKHATKVKHDSYISSLY
jgi:hypothetical protein